MTSREKILAAVKDAQPDLVQLPGRMISNATGTIDKFQQTLEAIGGKAIAIETIDDVLPEIDRLFPSAKRIISAITKLERHHLEDEKNIKHHTLHDADVVIIEAVFAVAENGAVWLTEEQSKIRVLPFIGEHLVVIVPKDKIVANMHQAYDVISNTDYGFGVFVAGPSKTADIEQSLVLGAHGPKSMTVLLLNNY